MTESKRIQKFRSKIIKDLPKFPNNRDTLATLEDMPLTTLLVHYLNWISRFIAVKSRRVVIEPAVTADQRWRSLKEPIEFFFKKIRTGENLTPHLSLQPQSRGYSPKTGEAGPKVDRWADKDFLLNVMGFHHFHLGTVLESEGHVERTNDVLFAHVNRETITAIGIFNHSVFELTREEMSEERQRLWKIFNERIRRGARPGSAVVASPIATSGHPIHLVTKAQDYSRVIREVDPQLDDPTYVERLFVGTGTDAPNKRILEWDLHFSDLGIVERSQGHFLVFRRGFN